MKRKCEAVDYVTNLLEGMTMNKRQCIAKPLGPFGIEFKETNDVFTRAEVEQIICTREQSLYDCYTIQCAEVQSIINQLDAEKKYLMHLLRLERSVQPCRP